MDRNTDNRSPETPENTTLSPGLQRLVTMLEYANDLTPPMLAQMLRSADLSLEDVASFIQEDADRYHREFVHRGDGFDILVLTWMPMQGSPIHGHDGSTCAFMVMTGVASETTFTATDPGRAAMDSFNRYETGEVAAMDGSRIHTVANVDRMPLVTLHVYSPPLRMNGFYELDVSGPETGPSARPMSADYAMDEMGRYTPELGVPCSGNCASCSGCRRD